jgi:hypothetical protein
MKTISRILILAMLHLCWLTSWGCLRKTIPSDIPSEEVRAHYGSVALVTKTQVVSGSIDAPPAGGFLGGIKGGFKGIFMGAGYGAQASGGSVAGIILMPFGAAIGLFFGGLSGLGEAHSPKVVRNTQKQIEKHLPQAVKHMQETLLGDVQLYAQQATLKNIIILTHEPPLSQKDPKSYRYLAENNIDTVWEVWLKKVDMVVFYEHEFQVTGPISLWVEVQTRVIRTRDEELLFQKDFSYISPPRPFPEWGKNNAEAIIQELQKARRSLYEPIVEQVFLQYRSLGEKPQEVRPTH